MQYVIVRQSKRYHQMTLEEFLGIASPSNARYYNYDYTSTRTYEYRTFEDVPFKFRKAYDLYKWEKYIERWMEKWSRLFDVEDRHELYNSFHIAKKSGGLRKIDAPNKELMTALRELKNILEYVPKYSNADAAVPDIMTYHTSAYAYIKGRNTIACVKCHQKNQSKWFGKYDIHNFFGSSTQEFVEKMMSQVFPFSFLFRNYKSVISKALSLCFLDGGLPQGTPISPFITNVIMIPFDFIMTKTLRDFERDDGMKQKFIYTRYADDFIISSRYDFDKEKIADEICSTLHNLNAPFSLNRSKTRYGSSAGRNWNLGIMLNSKNQMTIGHAAKRAFKNNLGAYALSKVRGAEWSLEDLQSLDGYRSYYTQIEGDGIKNVIESVSKKFGIDVEKSIRDDIKRIMSS